jgi:hypothetical protein
VRAIRSSAALACLALLALAGCGGGGGGSSGTSSGAGAVGSAPPPSATVPPGKSSTGTSSTPTATATTPAPTQTSTSPEQQPGGAGDEKPIATQALFTGQNGKVSPPRIRVPPFIAVRAVLRAADGGAYTLLVAGKELAVGEGRKRASVQLDGLRPGTSYVVRNTTGPPKRLVIVANAEPGP